MKPGMVISQREFAFAWRDGSEAPGDRGALPALARSHFRKVSEIGGEIEVEGDVRRHEAVVRDENVLMQTAADKVVDLDLNSFGDDFAPRRIAVARRGCFPPGGRRRKIVRHGRMRFDVHAGDRLHRPALGREAEAGKESSLTKIIAVLRRVDQTLPVQGEHVLAAVSRKLFGIDTQPAGEGKLHN